MRLSRISVFGIFILALLASCGKDKEKKQQQAKARQDSLQEVQQRMQKQRADSLAAARADSMAKAVNKQKEAVFNPSQYGAQMSPNGDYAVQTSAWRSKRKAQKLAQKWQGRGFEKAFVVKYGNKATGNIWFRVRLGKFFTEEAAQNLQEWLRKNYKVNSWMTYVG